MATPTLGRFISNRVRCRKESALPLVAQGEARDASLSRRGFSAAELVSYVPDFAIAGTFLITWLAPLTFGPKMIGYLLTVVLLELFVVMAASFIAGMAVENTEPDAVKIAIGFSIFFWIFPAVLGMGEGIWWLLWAYWLLLANRLWGVWRAPTGWEKELLTMSLFVQAGLWILFAFITARAAIPELGVTQEIVRAEELSGGGAWISQPHRMLAFGFLYFTAVAVTELVVGYRLAKRRAPERI